MYRLGQLKEGAGALRKAATNLFTTELNGKLKALDVDKFKPDMGSIFTDSVNLDTPGEGYITMYLAKVPTDQQLRSISATVTSEIYMNVYRPADIDVQATIKCVTGNPDDDIEHTRVIRSYASGICDSLQKG